MRAFMTTWVVALCLALAPGAARGEDVFQLVVPGIEAVPGPGGSVSPGDPVVHIRFSGDALTGASQAGVWLDGTALSEGLDMEGSELSVALPRDISPGVHTIKVSVPNLMGAPREAEWTFDVPQATGQVNVSVTPARGTLYEGDVLTVTAVGPADGEARASIDRRIRFDLPQTKPGTYQGSYTVTPADYVMSAPVVASIAFPDGTAGNGASATPVKIFGQLFTVRITEPASGGKVPWDFVIKGKTRPNATVYIAPSIGRPGGDGAVLGTRPPVMGRSISNMGTIETAANSEGVFEQKFGFPIRVIPMTYSFLVTARGPNGEEGIPASFVVTIGAGR